MDLGLVAHLSSVRSRLPFIHFFDGLRTSAEVSKVKTIPYTDMGRLLPEGDLRTNLRDLALNPQHPILRGSGQRPDIYFQGLVAGNRYYDRAPAVVEAAMDEVAQLTGRRYNLFDYFGAPDAERIIVLMGSAAETARETVEFLAERGEKVGMIQVRLYRPWSQHHFLKSLPATVRRMAVLDRTLESGAQGNPLFLDVSSTLMEASTAKGIAPPLITGGTYGLASKEFTPGMVKAILDNLATPEPRRRFVIGIDDDVTHTSLPYDPNFSTLPGDTTQCLFWGLGGDGTIGANKAAIKNLALEGGKYAQGFFVYDSHKENGATISHLRFGSTPIRAAYQIYTHADYVACHHPSYVRKFDLLSTIKPGGTFVLNCPWSTVPELEANLPDRLKRHIADRNIRFFVIPATQLALKLGLGHRINTIMQALFYELSGVLPLDKAIELLKSNITDMYSKKGPELVAFNHAAVDAAARNVIRVDYPVERWSKLINTEVSPGEQQRALRRHKNIPAPVNEVVDEFVEKIMDPVLALEGDKLPVSCFVPGGFMPPATTMHEERGLAPEIPVWKPEKCTMCNYCSVVCPHAVIRPFLLDRAEEKAAPHGYQTLRATGGPEISGLRYSLQVAPLDCTGCAVCVQSCPDDALEMKPFEEAAKQRVPHWEYSVNLPQRNPVDKFSVKGSQFQQPLLEFSGSCPGCGETPYVKMLTQLFGDRLVIANSSGCSSVWGGTAATNPYTVNSKGRGPAWGRSLFEDTAEYGFGMAMATKQRRLRYSQLVERATRDVHATPSFIRAAEQWLKVREDYDRADKWAAELEQLLLSEECKDLPNISQLRADVDLLRPISTWVVGGDGWAYDIGFGGLDHVAARGEKVNILVLDTEMYSNTGGQVSKSTPKAAVVKYAQGGKAEMKKDLGLMMMTYGNVYVASVALGADMNQCIQAFKEAESYPGTSIILAHSPCIDWGIDMRYMMESQKHAVDSGYWKLYRFDPRLRAKGLVPLQLDSARVKLNVKEYLERQNRFKQLVRKDREKSEQYFGMLQTAVLEQHERLQRQAMDNGEMLDHLRRILGEAGVGGLATSGAGLAGGRVQILYASETGTAQEVAKGFVREFSRRGMKAKAQAMDDFDLARLPECTTVCVVAATCGQGEVPENARQFWKRLSDPALPKEWLKQVQFAVFALGDSAYIHYNKVGKDLDARLAELGAKRIMLIGLGNDKDPEKWETAWNEWTPNLWQELKAPEPPEGKIPPPSYTVRHHPSPSSLRPDVDIIIPQGAKLLPLVKSVRMSPENHDRDIRHYEFDLKSSGIAYGLGDSLGVYPWNNDNDVAAFMDWYGVKPTDMVEFDDPTHTGTGQRFPSMMAAQQLFTQALDIFGRPGRRFYENLAHFARNEKEKSELKHFLSREGKADFQKFLKETPHYADLLQRWPSARIPLEYLVEFVPLIRPRLYSIASAPEMDGDRLQLCVVNEDWVTPSGRQRYGLTTRYLRTLENPKKGVPHNVAVRVNGASFTTPQSHKQPIILVALGTGIAPCRALIRDRIFAKSNGQEIGPMALFFGVRFRASEYSYGNEEWEPLHDNGKGPLTVLAPAFSRDQKHKIYVQHRIAEHKQMVYDWMVKQNGYYLLCGPSGPPCQASKEAVIQAIAEVGAKEGWTVEKARQFITDAQLAGRFNEEVW
eukprot:TRINITY_DN583_c0_g2_i1.p1 TRINITY_DN583_c0_g2~~TRINITY_DN583_c0_g2_i1.p1  ORF type:complete len:1924 (-),score=325.54 TRINITY_DN583_c0_g2_i1:205-5187(-)